MTSKATDDVIAISRFNIVFEFRPQHQIVFVIFGLEFATIITIRC